MVGLAAAGAVKGSMDAKAAKRRASENDKFRKVAIANSLWTGMADPGAPDVGNTDQFNGMLGGGLQGAAIGSMVNGIGGVGKEAPPGDLYSTVGGDPGAPSVAPTQVPPPGQQSLVSPQRAAGPQPTHDIYGNPIRQSNYNTGMQPRSPWLASGR